MFRVVLLGVLLIATAPFPWFVVSAEAPANEHFQRTWARTDLPVSVGDVARTWMWGPEGFTPAMSEPYAESPGGQRAVQYFDKSRMEITDPSAESSTTWYVTNGLLVVEMVTGQMQTGNSQFEERAPANVNIAGDADDPDSPGYADLAKRLDDEATPEQTVISAAIDGEGNLDPAANFGEAFVVLAAQHVPETGHTIAAPFWEFMNSSGTVHVGGINLEAPLFENAFFATGFPISEAYWTEILVGGTPTQVLLQCFERRCLTYTPSNDPAWQVEAGNVGRHYYAWRYEGDQPAPPPGEDVELECIALGYPCSLAESTPEAQDLIFQYGETMVSMMESGTPLADLLAWISEQPGVVDARGDDELIRFRVDGGNPAWVYDARIYAPAEPVPTAGSQPGADIIFESFAAPLPDNVVGKDLNGDGMTDDKPKRALVLSPFEHYFAPWDAAADIANMLRGARGYDEPGSVQEFRNPDDDDENVGVSHFMGWNAYSVIYVSSHGGEVCASNQLYGCDAFISTGEKISRETASKAAANGASAVFPGYIPTRSGYIGVSIDFFRNQYGLGGIENAIIYLDACRSHDQVSLWDHAGALPTLLSGFSSVVFGWELSVDSGHSADASRLIFKQAIDQGTPVARWFNEFQAATINDGSDSATLHVTTPEGADLRIRETVTMLNPLTEEPLQEGESIPIIGQLGDNETDMLPIAIRVDGVDADLSEFVVHVRVNDEDLPETFTLVDAEHVGGGFGHPSSGGPGIYELTDKRASLGRDVTADEDLDVMIWIELPEDGETKHSMASPPANPMLVFESSIISEAPAGGFEAESIVTAEMPLMLSADLKSIEPSSYELVYESYDIAIDGTSCSLESVRHNGTIEIVEADFPLDPESGKLTSFVPDRIVLRPQPNIYADTIIICPQGSFVMPGQDIHWYAGFVVGHEPELTPEGFRFRDWQAGSGDVFSTQDIKRSRTDDGMTVAADLHLEIRAPDAAPF